MSEKMEPAMPPAGRLILILSVIALISGVTIVFAYQITAEPIARNHRERLERAVFTVLPGAEQRVNYSLDDDGLARLAGEEIDRANVYAGYDSGGDLVGVALEASAMGYADTIRMLYGYSPQRECIIGFTVLQSSETPGLGALIATDPDFLANFECLDAELNEEQTALENEIRTVTRRDAEEDWEIDGITGATVSSEAVGRALRESAERYLPLLARYRDDLPEQMEAE